MLRFVCFFEFFSFAAHSSSYIHTHTPMSKVNEKLYFFCFKELKTMIKKSNKITKNFNRNSDSKNNNSSGCEWVSDCGFDVRICGCELSFFHYMAAIAACVRIYQNKSTSIRWIKIATVHTHTQASVYRYRLMAKFTAFALVTVRCVN